MAAEATAAFVTLLSSTVPEEGASAYLERVDSRFGPTTLVRYSGRATKRDDRGRPISGKWFLEEDVPGYSFPEFVEA